MGIVNKLQGKLLLIHGKADTSAPVAATMKLIDALVQADKPYDLVLLPDQDHHFDEVHYDYWLAVIHLPAT